MPELHALLGELLGAGVAFATGAPGDTPLSDLFPEEAEGLERAVEKRRREVASGRAAARRAMAGLRERPVAIRRGPGGCPIWPAGLVGTITHTDTLCAAAVARSNLVSGLGLDAEPEGPLEAELWPAIATAEELDALRRLSVPRAAERARWIFCAKEAAYKCQYPSTGLLLDFSDLLIRWHAGPEGGATTFEAVFMRAAGSFRAGDGIPGRLGRAVGHVLAATRIDAVSSPWTTSR